MMESNKNIPTGYSNRFLLEILIALNACVAVVFQAYLTTGGLGNLFSYFTILTNLLIAICSTTIVLFPNSNLGTFFKKPTVLSAITLYIFIVALVYNTVLRGLFPLDGWNFFVDTLLHVIVPILFIVYWFVFVPKGTLQYKNGISWLLFPFAYLLYSLLRGELYGWYPYPFLNVITFGYQKVILNSCVLIAVFLLSGVALIWLDKKLGRS